MQHFVIFITVVVLSLQAIIATQVLTNEKAIEQLKTEKISGWGNK